MRTTAPADEVGRRVTEGRAFQLGEIRVVKSKLVARWREVELPGGPTERIVGWHEAGRYAGITLLQDPFIVRILPTVLRAIKATEER